jgi:hypothetical protein
VADDGPLRVERHIRDARRQQHDGPPPAESYRLRDTRVPADQRSRRNDLPQNLDIV